MVGRLNVFVLYPSDIYSRIEPNSEKLHSTKIFTENPNPYGEQFYIIFKKKNPFGLKCSGLHLEAF